jgi:hypothetical protein
MHVTAWEASIAAEIELPGTATMSNRPILVGAVESVSLRPLLPSSWYDALFDEKI